METSALLAKTIQGNFEMLKSHLADFSEADLLVRPVPAANHANWQLGHLVGVEAGMCRALGLKAPELPADFATMYTKETAAGDDAAKFMKKDALLGALAETSAALAQWASSLTTDDLSKPAPPPFDKWVPTLGDLAAAIPLHKGMHIGQFQVIRRALGRKVMF